MPHQSRPAATASLNPPGVRRVSTMLRVHALLSFLHPWLALTIFVPIAVAYLSTGGFIDDGLIALVGERVTGRVVAVEADGPHDADRVTYRYQLPGGPPHSSDTWAVSGYASVGDPISLEVVDAPIEISRVVGTQRSAGSSPIGIALGWSVLFAVTWWATSSTRRMKLNFQIERLLRRGTLTTAFRVPRQSVTETSAGPEATTTIFQTRDAYGRWRELTLWCDEESQLGDATTLPVLVDAYTPGVALAMNGTEAVASGDTGTDVLVALDVDVVVTPSGGLASRTRPGPSTRASVMLFTGTSLLLFVLVPLLL